MDKPPAVGQPTRPTQSASWGRLVAVVYVHDITTYINIREISQMNHANKDLKEVKNL